MQVTLGYESQLDLVAEAVGLSPVDVRLRNFVEQGDRLPTHEPLDTHVAVTDTLRAALEALGPEADPRAGWQEGRTRLRVQHAALRAVSFFADRASCWVSLERDGSSSSAPA